MPAIHTGLTDENFTGAFDAYQRGIGNTKLFDPESLKYLSGILEPYFQQQRSNLGRAQTSALGDASRFGGAYAASRGYDNPYSFIESGRNKVYGTYAPQFGQLAEGQMGQLLNSTSQYNQFGRQGYQSMLNNLMGLANYDVGRQQQEDASSFNFFRDLLGPIIGVGGQLGAAEIGKP